MNELNELLNELINEIVSQYPDFKDSLNDFKSDYIYYNPINLNINNKEKIDYIRKYVEHICYEDIINDEKFIMEYKINIKYILEDFINVLEKKLFNS